jgi:hypothetical protein
VKVKITYITRTKREKHKENRKHRRFRTAYFLMAKIFSTMDAIDTPFFIKKNHKIYRDKRMGCSLLAVVPPDAVKATNLSVFKPVRN